MQEFEDYQENDEIAEIQKEFEMKERLREIKLKLANENYQALIQRGMDIEGMLKIGIDIEPIHRTLDEMLIIFQDLEEYEKCSKILEFIKEIENI